MKYLYLILLVSICSCSKPKDEPNGLPLVMNAEVIEQRWWAVSFTTTTNITSTGTASVEWDVYNDAGAFMYHRSATVNYTFDNSVHSTTEKTTVQGALSMNAGNGKIISFNGSGGYKFKY